MHAAAQRLRGAELAGITRALQRIETQTYGWCLQCGEPIATARLDVNPTAEYCVSCAERRET